jgi:hypothetical protein
MEFTYVPYAPGSRCERLVIRSKYESCINQNTWKHGCMASGGHGLPKVSPGPAMPYHSMTSEQAIPETAILGVARM